MADTIQRENFPAYKEFFQIMTGSENVHIFADAAGDNVSRIGDEWHIGLRIGDGIHALWHEAGHVKYESLTGIEKYLEKMTDERAKFVWNVAEDVRIERLAEKHFDKKIFEPHRQMILDNYKDYEPKALTLPNMVLATLYHLPWEMAGNANEMKALEYFKEELVEATYSEDPKATAQIAIRIAYYMDWLDKHPDDDDDDDVVCGYPGSTTTSEPDSSESTDSPSPDKPEDEPADEPDVPTQPSAPPVITKPVEYDERLQEDLHKLLKGAATNASKAGRTKKSASTRPTGRARRRTEEGTGTGVGPTDSHSVIEVAPPTEPIVMGAHARLLLDSLDDDGARMRHSGTATPSAWRLNHGYTKVFSRRPKTKGKVICLVDLSGSMYCWCAKCQEEYSTYTVNSGYLAWQTVGVLTSRFPDIEVFGFASSHDENYILPVPAREQPLCRSEVNKVAQIDGNADCTALAWLRSYLGAHESEATAIVITDGNPGSPYPIRCDSYRHTKQIAREIHDAGMRYASVLINRDPTDLYPSEVQVSVNNADDIANLQGVLDWLIAS